MKRRLLNGILFMLVIFTSAGGTLTKSMDFDTSDVSIVELFDEHTRTSRVKILWTGMDTEDREGFPDLPLKFITMEVPMEASNFRVAIKSIVWEGDKKLPKPLNLVSTLSSSNVSSSDKFDNSASQPIVRIIDDFYIKSQKHYIVAMITPIVKFPSPACRLREAQLVKSKVHRLFIDVIASL